MVVQLLQPVEYSTKYSRVNYSAREDHKAGHSFDLSWLLRNLAKAKLAGRTVVSSKGFEKSFAFSRLVMITFWQQHYIML